MESVSVKKRGMGRELTWTLPFSTTIGWAGGDVPILLLLLFLLFLSHRHTHSTRKGSLLSLGLKIGGVKWIEVQVPMLCRLTLLVTNETLNQFKLWGGWGESRETSVSGTTTTQRGSRRQLYLFGTKKKNERTFFSVWCVVAAAEGKRETRGRPATPSTHECVGAYSLSITLPLLPLLPLLLLLLLLFYFFLPFSPSFPSRFSPFHAFTSAFLCWAFIRARRRRRRRGKASRAHNATGTGETRLALYDVLCTDSLQLFTLQPVHSPILFASATATTNE